MIQAFKELLGLYSIESYDDMFLVICCLVVILFTVNSLLVLISSLFRGKNS